MQSVADKDENTIRPLLINTITFFIIIAFTLTDKKALPKFNEIFVDR